MTPSNDPHNQVFYQNLSLIHEILADSPLRGKFGVFGSVLLLLYRDGDLPPDFLPDLDLYYVDEHHEELMETIPALEAAGFRKLYKFIGNDGTIWEHSFAKDGGKFEFLKCERVGGRLEYMTFAPHWNPPFQQRHFYPDTPFVGRELGGLVWPTCENIEDGLLALYGENWHIPDPGFDYATDPQAFDKQLYRFADRIKWVTSSP